MSVRKDRFAAPLAALALVLALPGAAPAMPTDGGVPQRYMGYDPNVEYREGLAALRDDKFRDAKQHFDRVLKVVPGHPVALWRMAEAEEGLGDLKGAVRDYEAALKQDPRQIRPASELAVDQEKLGRHAEAAARLEDFKRRSAACADACPDAVDLEDAVRNIESVMPPGAGGAAHP